MYPLTFTDLLLRHLTNRHVSAFCERQALSLEKLVTSDAEYFNELETVGIMILV
jgi:hypothetical protein